MVLVIRDISSEVMDEIQDEGATASFSCQATGEPVPIISWYFNGILLADGATHTISETSINTTIINSTLTIMSVKSFNVGTYTCNATNVVSSDTSSGVLTVNGELKYLSFICKVTNLLQLPQTLLHQWKDNSLISLKGVMDQSHVQLQVILYQQLYGRTVMGVV